MKAPCEDVVKYLLPALRALIAEKLIEDYGLSQAKVAKVMSVSQPAVSYYCRAKRGLKAYPLIKGNEKLKPLIDELTEAIYKGAGTEETTCIFRKICHLAREMGIIPFKG